MASITYRYELRRGDSVTTTGHISFDEALKLGDSVQIGKSCGMVRDLGPRDTNGEIRLVVQLDDS